VFVAEALRSIEDIDELKLILYLFWRFGQKRPAPRFLKRSTIAADSVIREGLGLPNDGSLNTALDRLVADQLLLRRTVMIDDTRDECYFLNTSAGRRGVAELEAGSLDVSLVAIPEEPLRSDPRSSIFQLYEQNVGMLSPLIVEELSAAERDYPGDWIEEAFRESVRYNRRSWSYVQRILQRWAVEGKGDQTAGGRPTRSGRSAANRGRG
jgi:DnaD/phage-associated family protein